MLTYLKISNVGPSPIMELDLGERLNLITGDNGLGKSFLLDIVLPQSEMEYATNQCFRIPSQGWPIGLFVNISHNLRLFCGDYSID
jgi:hypothetical protein